MVIKKIATAALVFGLLFGGVVHASTNRQVGSGICSSEVGSG